MTERFDHKAQRILEKRILVALVNFYFEAGHKEKAYIDPSAGGLYENKLAARMGYDPTIDLPTPEFTAATRSLAAKGLVVRIQRNPSNPLMGVWPTAAGIDKAELWGGSLSSRLQGLMHQQGTPIVVAALISIAASVGTILLAVAKGWFGLKVGR